MRLRRNSTVHECASYSKSNRVSRDTLTRCYCTLFFQGFVDAVCREANFFKLTTLETRFGTETLHLQSEGLSGQSPLFVYPRSSLLGLQMGYWS
jgi:hypothetical protein